MTSTATSELARAVWSLAGNLRDVGYKIEREHLRSARHPLQFPCPETPGLSTVHRYPPRRTGGAPAREVHSRFKSPARITGFPGQPLSSKVFDTLLPPIPSIPNDNSFSPKTIRRCGGYAVKFWRRRGAAVIWRWHSGSVVKTQRQCNGSPAAVW